jgi:hypothetical protein
MFSRSLVGVKLQEIREIGNRKTRQRAEQNSRRLEATVYAFEWLRNRQLTLAAILFTTSYFFTPSHSISM